MTQTILIAIAALAIDLLILRWAYRETVYGSSLLKYALRAPCTVLIVVIPFFACAYLAEKGFIQ